MDEITLNLSAVLTPQTVKCIDGNNETWEIPFSALPPDPSIQENLDLFNQSNAQNQVLTAQIAQFMSEFPVSDSMYPMAQKIFNVPAPETPASEGK
jgi:hypothetical protein